ncbi:TauD/TfdA family dioxygenase (plasmid) [Paraburkholderia sp. PREW-6R]|uniref:TauD/TfdA family dioxygenase n=1 Tax=Paraburkholderia sp. PREW-6R TaxID=3141544 RepID=UPI0031F54312
MQQTAFETTTRPLPETLIVETRLDLPDVAVAHTLMKRGSDLNSPDGRAALRWHLQEALPRWAQCAEAILRRLAKPPHFCVVRSFPWVDLSPGQYHATITALVSLLGDISNDNAYGSKTVADDVRPIDPLSSDVTYSFDCEVHADESSKPKPEDIVTLWCVRQANRGGTSFVWSVAEVLGQLRSMPDGLNTEQMLRDHLFPFGGKLRRPVRVLLAPIVFGRAGIRFRLGAILDAFDVLSRSPSIEEESAIAGLLEAIRRTPAYEFNLERGEVSCMMNRMTLHSRATFSDESRWLIRCRLNNAAYSNTCEDRDARWIELP